MAHHVAALLRATHVQPSIGVTVIATALAVSAGRGAESAWVGAAVLAGQFSIGWSNDWLDRHRDRATDRSDKPIVSGAVDATIVGRAAVAALVLCVPLSLAAGLKAGLVHLVAVGLAWSYNLRLKATAVSVLPWAGAFALLPAVATLGLPRTPWPAWWALAAGALLGAAAHFTNALPDLDDDVRQGVRGLPHRIGPRWSLRLAATLLACGLAVLVLGPETSTGGLVALAVGVALVAGVIVAGNRGDRRAAFRLTTAVAVLAAGAFVWQGSALV